MKNLKRIGIVVLAISFMSFSILTEKTINTTDSTINWIGEKVTGKHEGTIKLKSGTLIFDGDNLKGGNFVVDMTSLIVTDLSGGGKTKLEGHLKSDDFFGVANHETAKLSITSVSQNDKNTYDIEGDLTIKGKTNSIEFNMTIDGNSAIAKLKVDRTKYGIRYGSASFFNDLKDKAIYDEFDLNVNLKF
jgi:polyisoprenoid-binding protein YceI